ncbi:MAG: hypothetical protein A2Z91_08715 [Deltaproteobacteria bacterium GWA2_38_16]|nr:MAG: hypothetical protein A2Z91_08715 [Deltaproteobacteria bacterium GWA2_38_16]OGQ03876.1 MAG: hypothetical protein A3D19_07280 [Deltaproteobacteria bacterium RIFCSPHIGHO2_02_FULL_38_15]OGQ59901.1 MAG: hypothetical protein A3G92_06750 [Deltaproteobacteria bacterium RIFCSPLOWO2_12_FULL_38_8]HBQ20922.1 hypothetical protein [Deltaproteobacteria bacterium]
MTKLKWRYLKMKKIILTVLTIVFVTTNAGAIVMRPGHERPIFGAAMEKVDAQGHFELASNIFLELTKRDSYRAYNTDPTGMLLTYTVPSVKLSSDESDQFVSQKLVITDKRDVGCGSVQYIASLRPEPILHYLPVEKTREMQHRFTVVLIDHSQRVCEDYRPYLWEASVREGYGWCGTMDATMEIVGNPERVYTIQPLNEIN